MLCRFASFGLLDRFNIKSSTLEQFIMEVRAKYNDNPYHCFRHAFDVTQTCYAILTSFVRTSPSGAVL